MRDTIGGRYYGEMAILLIPPDSGSCRRHPRPEWAKDGRWELLRTIGGPPMAPFHQVYHLSKLQLSPSHSGYLFYQLRRAVLAPPPVLLFYRPQQSHAWPAFPILPISPFGRTYRFYRFTAPTTFPPFPAIPILSILPF